MAAAEEGDGAAPAPYTNAGLACIVKHLTEELRMARLRDTRVVHIVRVEHRVRLRLDFPENFGGFEFSDAYEIFATFEAARAMIECEHDMMCKFIETSGRNSFNADFFEEIIAPQIALFRDALRLLDPLFEFWETRLEGRVISYTKKRLLTEYAPRAPPAAHDADDDPRALGHRKQDPADDDTSAKRARP